METPRQVPAKVSMLVDEGVAPLVNALGNFGQVRIKRCHQGYRSSRNQAHQEARVEFEYITAAADVAVLWYLELVEKLHRQDCRVSFRFELTWQAPSLFPVAILTVEPNDTGIQIVAKAIADHARNKGG